MSLISITSGNNLKIVAGSDFWLFQDLSVSVNFRANPLIQGRQKEIHCQIFAGHGGNPGMPREVAVHKITYTAFLMLHSSPFHCG